VMGIVFTLVVVSIDLRRVENDTKTIRKRLQGNDYTA
jgi:hypothetical protein